MDEDKSRYVFTTYDHLMKRISLSKIVSIRRKSEKVGRIKVFSIYIFLFLFVLSFIGKGISIALSIIFAIPFAGVAIIAIDLVDYIVYIVLGFRYRMRFNYPCRDCLLISVCCPYITPTGCENLSHGHFKEVTDSHSRLLLYLKVKKNCPACGCTECRFDKRTGRVKCQMCFCSFYSKMIYDVVEKEFFV